VASLLVGCLCLMVVSGHPTTKKDDPRVIRVETTRARCAAENQAGSVAKVHTLAGVVRRRQLAGRPV
jgi:hypothetical protein